MDLRPTIEALAAIGGGERSGPGGSPTYRGSATAGERLAADWLEGTLSAAGWRVRRQPFAGSSSSGARFLIHVAIAAAAAALLPVAPTVALAATLAAGLSLLAEQSAQVRVLSRLLPARPSQNLEARLPGPDADDRPTLVLCAHYDTQRTGWCWSDPVQRLSARFGFLPVVLRVTFVPETLAVLAQIVLAAVAIGRPLSAIGWGVLALLAATHAVYLVMLANWAGGRFVPGATDNASGVAAVLHLAERWRTEPVDGVDLRVLLTSCEETGMLGAAAWATENRHLRGRCVFLNLDGLGWGPPHYLTHEVPVVGVPRRYDRRLLDLAAGIATGFPTPAETTALPGPTDGLAFLARGFRGLTVFGCQPGGRLPYWHQLGDTPEHVDFIRAEETAAFAWRLLRAMAADLRGP